MAETTNAVCSICGKGYYMCVSCKDKMSLTPWKLHTDTSEHYKIFQILRGVTIGVFDKEEARNRLKNIDLSDLGDFKPNVKSRIMDILREEIIVNEIEENITKRVRRKKNTNIVGTE